MKGKWSSRIPPSSDVPYMEPPQVGSQMARIIDSNLPGQHNGTILGQYKWYLY